MYCQNKTRQNNKETPDKKPKLIKSLLKMKNKQHRASQTNNTPETKNAQILNIGNGKNWQNSSKAKKCPKN